MGIFGWLKSKVDSDSDAAYLRTGGKSLSRTVSELSNSPFWSCVMQLAKMYASLPLEVYSKDSGGKRVAGSSALSALMDNPNQWQNSYEFRFCMALNYELHGEALAIVKRTPRGTPFALLPVPTGSMVAFFSDTGGLYYRNGITDAVYPAADVLSIKHTPNGLTSVLSPLKYATGDIDLENKCRQMQQDYFDGGTIMGNVIKVPSSMTKDQKDEIKAQFDSNHGYRNIVMNNTIELTPIQATNLDVSKLVEAQKWTAKQVASRFQVPGFFVGITDGAYNNLEDQSLYFMTYCLNPRLVSWEKACRKALCGERDYIEFNREGILQGNSTTKINFLSSAVNNGIMTHNEARRKLNLPDYDGEGGNDLLVQSGLGTLENVVNGKYGQGGIWNEPAEGKDPPGEPVVEKAVAEKVMTERDVTEKRQRDLLFVEEATRQAKSARKALETLLRKQTREEVEHFKELLKNSTPDMALLDFREFLNDKAAEYKPAYVAIYTSVAAKLLPVVMKQVGTDRKPSEEESEQFVSEYVDSLQGRHAGFVNKRAGKVIDMPEEDREEEFEHLVSDYPINEASTEVNRSSNALSLFMFAALGVVAYHIVASADACNFCQALDGQTAEIHGYVLSKGAEVPDGDGGIRKIDKNYRHPPFHTGCACHVAPGE